MSRLPMKRNDEGASLILVLFALTFVAFVVSIVLGLTQTGFLSGSQAAKVQANRLNVENALQAANGFLAKGGTCSGGTYFTYNGVAVTCTATTAVSGTDTSGTGLSGIDPWGEAVTLRDTGTSFIQNDFNHGSEIGYQGGTFLVQGNFQTAGGAQITGGNSSFSATKCLLSGGGVTAAVWNTTNGVTVTNGGNTYTPMLNNGCVQTVVYPGALGTGSATSATTMQHLWSNPAPNNTTTAGSLKSLSVPSQLPTVANLYNGKVGDGTKGTISTGNYSCQTYSSGHKYMLLTPGYYTETMLNNLTGGLAGSFSKNCAYNGTDPATSAPIDYLVIMQPGYYYVSMNADWVIQAGTRVIGGYGVSSTDTSTTRTATTTVANLRCDTPGTQLATGQDTGVLLTIGNASAGKIRNGIIVSDSGYNYSQNGNSQGQGSAAQNTLSLCAGFTNAISTSEPIALYGYFGSGNLLGSGQAIYPASTCTATNADPSSYQSGSSTWCPLLANPLSGTGQSASNDSTIGLQGAIYAESDSLGLVVNAPATNNGNQGDNGGNGNGLNGSVLITYGVDLNGLNVLNIGSTNGQEGDGGCQDGNENGQGQNYCGGNVPAWQPVIAEPVSAGFSLSATSGTITGTETVTYASNKLSVLTWKEN